MSSSHQAANDIYISQITQSKQNKIPIKIEATFI